MKNNKGFTLIELMAVITIIAIIIAIAVPSYINITNSTNEKMYQNKVTTIIAKAEEYASDNNIDNTSLSVAKLIEEGYLEPDNTNGAENELITNPKGGYMDCNIVNIAKLDGEYNITVDSNNDCTMASNDNITSNITIYAYPIKNNTLGTSLGSNSSTQWSNQDVLLYADLGKVKNDIKSNNITWSAGASSQTKSNGIIEGATANYNDYANEILVSASVFLNTKYQMSIELNNGIITKTVSVKIDKEKPYVDATVNDKWSNGNKDILITGSDGTGSGVDKFYIGTTKTIPSINQFNITSVNNQTTQKLDVGTYYIYSKDLAGNISDAKEIQINNVDKTGPVCKYAVVPTTFTYNSKSYPWSHDDITLTYGCSTDSQSGCKTTDFTKTYNAYANETINWTIEDNIGNKTNCSQSVEIKIDKTQPTITANSNPISLGNQDYNFLSNVKYSFGQGSGTTTCDPAVSRKTGSYNVTCTAAGNNGLNTPVTFLARHSYTGTYHYVSRTCDGESNCHGCDSCACTCGNVWCYFDGRLVGDRCCGCDVTCHSYRCCDHYSYDCSYGYYTCDLGGSLSGSTCYY